MKKIGLRAVFDDKDFTNRLNRYVKGVEKATYAVDRLAKANVGSTKSYQSVDQMVDNLRTDMEKNIAEMEKQDQAQQANAISAEMWSEGLTKVGVALGAVGAAGSAVLISSTQLAARVETLGVVTAQLGKNVGFTEKEIRGLEAAVVDQGITLRSARESMALMVQANIDLAYASDLARLAQDAAVIANKDSSEAFRTLVYTISAGNVRMARQLGLQVNFQSAYKKTADAVGKTTLELTEQEKVNARVNAIMDAGANIAGTYEAAMTTAGKKVLSLNRHIEESRRILGEAFLPLFADLVDATTNLLKKWEDLDPATQKVASTALGAATAFAVLAGGALVLTGQLVSLAASASIAGIAIGGVLAPIVLLVGGLGAVVVEMISFARAHKEMINELRNSEKEIANTSDSYDVYSRAIDNLAESQNRYVLVGEEYTDRIKKGGLSALYAENAVYKMTEAQWEQYRANVKFNEQLDEWEMAVQGIRKAASELTDEEEDLKTAEEKAAEAAKKQEEAERKLQQTLNQRLTDLKQLVSFNITEMYENMTLEIERAEDQEKELNKRIQETNEQIAGYRKEIQKIKDEEGPLTEEQKDRIAGYNARIVDATETLGELKGELGEIPGEIDKIREAWDRQTKQMIFDLAVQRLSLDGLTTEELSALGKLAGPEGFDLIDEASQRLIEGIGLAADEMAEAGDQSDIFIDILEGLQSALGDTEVSVDELGESINDLPTKYELSIEYDVGKIPVLGGKKLLEFEEWAGPVMHQKGGKLTGFDILGDKGPEMIVGNQIYPADQTRKYLDAISEFVKVPQELMTPRQATYTQPPSYSTVNTITNEGGNYNLTIHSQARTEDLIASYRFMRTMGSRV